MAYGQICGDNIMEASTRVVERTDIFGAKAKRLIIEGVGIQCDVPGINNRSYPKAIIEREINRLNKDMVAYGRLAGELNHPRLDAQGDAKDYPIFEMNLYKACALVEDMHMEGNNLMVRMLVMEGTQGGDQLAALIRNGYHPGFSLRGAGSTINVGDHEEIADDYTMITIDVVGNPSFGQAAIFNSRTESVASRPNGKVLVESVTNPAVISRINNYSQEVAMYSNRLMTGYNTFDKKALISAMYRSL